MSFVPTARNKRSFYFQDDANRKIELRVSFNNPGFLPSFYLNFYHNYEEIAVPEGIELWIYTTQKGKWTSQPFTKLPLLVYVNDGFSVKYKGENLIIVPKGAFFLEAIKDHRL